MKHIIVEGIDRVGKSTLIKFLAEHFNYDNVHIRHFGKPIKSKGDILSSQQSMFVNEARLLRSIKENEKQGAYFENIVIWNRSHIGEYTHGHLHRGYSKRELKSVVLNYDKNFLDLKNTFLIFMYADPEFCMKMEDGNSLSQDLDKKEKEIKLFKEAMEISLIENKINIKVNKKNNFKDKKEIFNEILKFIK